MANNSFGRIFRITTWGESHGKAMGVVIDGCPAGLAITEEEIQQELTKRAPGNHPFTSPRKEPDQLEILSGIYEGKTLGSPIAILIRNRDADSQAYKPIEGLLRPGHANYTYKEKYGHFDPRGGGRASGRETVGRVAAGAIAKKLLSLSSIQITSSIEEIGGECDEAKREELLKKALEAGDSLGGIVGVTVKGLPVGLGDPVYGRLDALLAEAMLSIPASKGFEIGEGFEASRMRGSEHNDAFVNKGKGVETETNHAGGVLGGISTGMPLYFRVAFKPTSSIRVPQKTLTEKGEAATLVLSENARHDPCIAIRAAVVVEAMTALVIADAMLYQRVAKI